MTTSDGQTCTVVRTSDTYTGKQGLSYFAGISAQNSGAHHLCLLLVTIPPGGRAKAHLHEEHETALYVLSGESGMWYGDQLQEYVVLKAGDFCHIPPRVPHLPINLSQTEPCVAVIARTDPNEQESVVLLPELEQLRSKV
ncbi:MAG: cupin domain-containing protein [Thermomicrobiales bacterium]